ncbi:MAG: asparaginase [Clostridia bacterium]|jgi:L-asparaginase II
MKPLVAITRSQYIESVHSGYICVVDANGSIQFSLGDPNTRVYFRSAAKPIQSIPFLESGAAEALGFSMQEIAIACASHTGQKIHQETVRKLMERLQLQEEQLHCGIMEPYNKEEKERLIREGKEPSVLHNSCSGKHVAMMALALYRGYSLEDYEKKENPVQQEVLNAIAAFAGEEPESIPLGIDGCGVPVFLLPIHKIALSYARLMAWSMDDRHPYYKASQRVCEAMWEHPEMVAGDGEFCTELMRAAKGQMVGKIGAEAIYCVGVKNPPTGICVKIRDGSERALFSAVLHTLKELRLLHDDVFAALQHWYQPTLYNHHGKAIGEMLPVFTAESAPHSSEILGRMVSELLDK